MYFFKVVRCTAYAIFFCALCSCNSQKDISSAKSYSEAEPAGLRISDLDIEEAENSPLDGVPADEILPPPPPKDNLPPNSYLIIGRISTVQESGTYSYKRGKCGKEPCFANVKIEKLIQTGMGVITDLSMVEEAMVFFPNTLNGFNYGKTKLESLTEADRISALIQLSESNEAWASDGMSHTIIRYTKL